MQDLSLLSITVVLFLIMDPIGNISAYLNLMRDIPPSQQKWILVREIGIALIAMLAFNWIGEYIFNVLEISETTVRLSSGIILFLIAIKILFPSTNGLRSNLPAGEPFVVPLAIPLIAGPSLLATIMLYAHMESSAPIMILAILIATFACLTVLLAAPQLKKLFGSNGLLALEKLMGMVLVLLAVQRFADGLQQFNELHIP